jgi:hypothetical protein
MIQPFQYWVCNSYLRTVFAKEHWLFTWAHELTKSRRKAWHLSLHFVSVFALNHSVCSHLAVTLESRKDRPDQ